MADDYTIRQKEQALKVLTGRAAEFIAAYHAIYALNSITEKNVKILDLNTIEILERLIRTDPFKKERKGYFLYREAASVSSRLMTCHPCEAVRKAAKTSLTRLLSETCGNAHRACAEALGSLPISVRGPVLKKNRHPKVPTVSFNGFLRANNLKTNGLMKITGRSLVIECNSANQLLVLKIARKNDDPYEMANEIHWLEILAPKRFSFSCRFNIPIRLGYKKSNLFKIKDLPVRLKGRSIFHPGRYAIAFLAHKDYFIYPNGSGQNWISCSRTFQDIMRRNARLAGQLTAMGIIHDALIPLFHNRIQRFRREDQGRYQWFRAGRLDRWLDSCEYPNIGLSGLRDFEHLVSFNGDSRMLYRHIGSHFLSLFLITGSYFRNKNRKLAGIDKNGNPVDARNLFDKAFLKTIIEDIFSCYYEGFTKSRFTDPLPVDTELLAERMIEEMGVDRHMKEYLRKADQKNMTHDEFTFFLRERGYPEKKLKDLTKGDFDIAVMSGPHLGDFNRSISIPELIECVAGMSAICISEKHLLQSKQAA